MGDAFVRATDVHYLQQREEDKQNLYTAANHDTIFYYTDKEFDPSLVSRLHNMFVRAKNDADRLPKAIVLVMHNDILRFAKANEASINVSVPMYITWIAKEFCDLLNAYKDKLPLRARTEDYPRILWVESPTHRNFEDNSLLYYIQQTVKQHHG